MDDYRPAGLGFIFAWMGDFGKTRERRFSAVCALALTCACLPVASAGQSGSGDAAPAKTATPSTTRASAANHSSAAKKPASRSHTASTRTSPTRTAANAKHTSRKKKTARVRGQEKIDSERATTIQEALIREHYLNGEPTGTWNEASEEAMRRYQADHGWQTKEVPDARALIRLGLGPDNAHLLNPESAMTSAPAAPPSAGPAPTSQTPAPLASPAVKAPALSDPPQPH